jgi:type 1 fimbria pilin
MMNKIRITVCLLIAAFSSILKAEQTGDVVTYNFSGTFVISSPCVINNDEVMDISFGNVGVKRVDGTNYKQIIPYSVDCHGAPDDSPLDLTVTGNATNYDQAALATSAEGLGIQIQANGQPMQLNKALSMTLGELSSLELTAVPVKGPEKELTARSFTATATLTAAYQ